jgi:hypothetical protein
MSNKWLVSVVSIVSIATFCNLNLRNIQILYGIICQAHIFFILIIKASYLDCHEKIIHLQSLKFD